MGSLARRHSAAVAWALAAASGLWVLVRVLGLERGFPVVPLLAYTPYAAFAAVLSLAIALVLRRWVAAGIIAVAGAVLVALVLPRAFGGPQPEPVPDGPSLRVLTANLRFGGADLARLVELIEEKDADVVSVQELTPDAVAELRGLGLIGLLPHVDLEPGTAADGTGVYSRFALERTAATEPAEMGYATVYARVRVPKAPPVELVAVHPRPPSSPAGTAAWGRDLEELPPAKPDGTLRILAGDFNATLDHARLRKIVDTGYTDAADAVGAGLAPTWFGGLLPPAPPVTIDHVLVDERIGVRAYEVDDLPGSDHRAVLAELVLPGRERSAR